MHPQRLRPKRPILAAMKNPSSFRPLTLTSALQPQRNPWHYNDLATGTGVLHRANQRDLAVAIDSFAHHSPSNEIMVHVSGPASGWYYASYTSSHPGNHWGQWLQITQISIPGAQSWAMGASDLAVIPQVRYAQPNRPSGDQYAPTRLAASVSNPRALFGCARDASCQLDQAQQQRLRADSSVEAPAVDAFGNLYTRGSGARRL